MNEFLYHWAESNGNRLKINPISRLQDLKTEIDDFKNTEELNDFQKWIVDSMYQFDIPEVDFPIRSILLIALSHPLSTPVEFVKSEKTYRLLSPVVPNFDQIKNDLSGFLAVKGYHLQYASNLPLKRLAVKSGLAVYGRNNICYVEGMGSAFSFDGYYTDVQADEDKWGEVRQADQCAGCLACINNCPTGALRRDRFLIDNEICLANLNEVEGEFPKWLPKSVHHCLYDCLKCQIICPMNLQYLNNTMEPVRFDAKETEMLINGCSFEEFSSALKQKTILLGLDQWIRSIPRNLKVLFELCDQEEGDSR